LPASTTNITSECKSVAPLLDTCIGVSAALPAPNSPSAPDPPEERCRWQFGNLLFDERRNDEFLLRDGRR
jgi:hypothetical protein